MADGLVVEDATYLSFSPDIEWDSFTVSLDDLDVPVGVVLYHPRNTSVQTVVQLMNIAILKCRVKHGEGASPKYRIDPYIEYLCSNVSHPSQTEVSSSVSPSPTITQHG